MILSTLRDVATGAIIALSLVLLLMTDDRQLEAIGILLAVIAYRLWFIGAQQRQQIELLAFIAEDDKR